eukprot:Tamp_25130.p1 GENE.Tamp_25130~~Tamp_25130.p1  ORF type:complete len:174 (+),score=47.31 Tamp_25130:36-524(+)
MRASTRLAATQRRSFADEAPKASQGIPSKLTLNLLAPHQAIFKAQEVDQVIIPGADGMFGVLPGHVPTISELKPGVLEVTTAPGEITKYFISSGFAFAHADSTLDVCGIEIVKLEDLDASLVSSGKTEAEAALGRATEEVEKAKAQIAVEVYTAMTEALNAK